MQQTDTYTGSDPNDGFNTGNLDTTLDDLTIEELTDLLINQYPDLEDLILQLLEDNPDITAEELLAALQQQLETDEDREPITVTVNTKTGTLFMNQLRDLAFAAEHQIRIKIKMNDAVVLDNLYQPSFDNLVHLDLQDLVLNNTVNYLPTICPEDDAEIDGIVHQFHAHSSIYAEITKEDGSQDTYYFLVMGFESGAADRCSDVDFLRIPKDYLLPISLYMTPDEQRYCTVAAFLESGQRKMKLNEGSIAVSDSSGVAYGQAYILSKDIPISSTPARPGEHFKFRLVTDGVKPAMQHHTTSSPAEIYHREITTPVLEIVNGQFEQYIFLNKYGHYDNIPMSGAKTFTPEYDIENASRSYSIEKVSSTKQNLWTQNTGPQTIDTLTALSELLLSPEIFHYIPGKSLRRIVVESPSLVVNSRTSIHTASFSWRYATK